MSATAPLVILDDRGAAYDVVRCNAKSRAKSLEQGELWIVRSDTGRILPYGRGHLHGPIRSHDDRWYAVHLTQLPKEPQPAPPTQPSSSQRLRPAPDACASSSQRLRPAPDACARAARFGDVLDPLTTTIAARKRELPPGSYTTYLFEQGVDKIKKKAAEEAVELVLAAAESEIVNEAADLIYHVLVLFAAHEIDFERVLLELQRRHS